MVVVGGGGAWLGVEGGSVGGRGGRDQGQKREGDVGVLLNTGRRIKCSGRPLCCDRELRY